MSILTQPEGIVTGTAVKLFTVAGPVLVFGISAGVVYGIVLWIIGLSRAYKIKIQKSGKRTSETEKSAAASRQKTAANGEMPC